MVRLGLFCPITSKVKGYPFEVAVRLKATGMNDQQIAELNGLTVEEVAGL